MIGIIVNYHIKMLYFIGLGLGDAKDITVKGLEIVKSCSRVYLVRTSVELCCLILTVISNFLEIFD